MFNTRVEHFWKVIAPTDNNYGCYLSETIFYHIFLKYQVVSIFRSCIFSFFMNNYTKYLFWWLYYHSYCSKYKAGTVFGMHSVQDFISHCNYKQMICANKKMITFVYIWWSGGAWYTRRYVVRESKKEYGKVNVFEK